MKNKKKSNRILAAHYLLVVPTLAAVLLVLVFLLTQCSSQESHEVISIDPNKTQLGKITLSDMIESIEYIPLETNTNCLVGEIRDRNCLLVSNNYILVYCNRSGSYYLFSRTGKFLAKIGNEGRGPGEYPIATRIVSINEELHQISIVSSSSRKLFFYDFNGKYLHSKSFEQTFLGGSNFNLIKYDENYYAMFSNNANREEDPLFTYNIFSEDLKLLAQNIKPVYYTMLQRGTLTQQGNFCYYSYDGLMHIKKATLNDTVYQIKNLSFVPKYIINAGKYSFTTEVLRDAKEFGKEFHNRTMIFSIFETNNYLLISYNYDQKDFHQYYDKSRKETFLFNSASGIPNDYDGGLDFSPKQQNDNEYITWYHAYHFDENDNKLSPKASPKDVERFKTVTKEVLGVRDPQTNKLMEANPVIVIVKFK